MKAMILCAGLGERLRPVTESKAKPAVEFLNVPMLAYPYFAISQVGLTDLVFNTHHLPETIRHAAMHIVPPGTALHFTFEPHLLGSGGGICHAKIHLETEDHFIVANGDAVVLFEDLDEVKKLVDHHIRAKALATLLVCPLPGVGDKLPGVWVGDRGKVSGFGKRHGQSGQCFHFASYMVLSKQIFNYLPSGSSNILYDACVAAIADQKLVQAIISPNIRWFETGNPSEFLSATESCLQSMRTGDRWAQGLNKMMQHFAVESQWIRNRDGQELWWVDQRARFAESVYLQGFGVIGNKAQIGDGAVLKNAVVLPGARVDTRQSIQNSIFLG